jgi:hypothetical protein
MILVPGHWMIIDGYRTRLFGLIDQVHIVDPWPAATGGGGKRTGWLDIRFLFTVGYYTLAAGTPSARAEISEVLTDDDDDDKIRDFDEGYPGYPDNRPRRFHCKYNEADSDSDQVLDKAEIRNYTFHDTTGYHPGHKNDDLGFPDIDNDGLRAEHDCDSDNDTEFDGGEDINGDGHNPVPAAPPGGWQGETCQFDSTMFCLKVNVDNVVYFLGEPVYIVDDHGSMETHTYHKDSWYKYESDIGFPMKVNGDPILWVDSFQTTGGGCAIRKHVTDCLEPGDYHLYVDILSDYRYSAPYNHDPYTLWMCEELWYVGFHPGDHYDYYNPEWMWLYDYPMLCTTVGEVEAVVDIYSAHWGNYDWPVPSRDYWMGVSVPADLYFDENLWINQQPAFVYQDDGCSGTTAAEFQWDSSIEEDLNEQFGDEATYWLGYQLSGWQLHDSIPITNVQLTVLAEVIRSSDIPVTIKMGDSDNGWALAFCDTLTLLPSPSYVCGDADASQSVDIDDVVYLINYIFSGGSEPVPYESGDADCSGGLDIDDVVWLIAYIFSGGNAPCDLDGDGVPDC